MLIIIIIIIRAEENSTRLDLGCIEADFLIQILVGIGKALDEIKDAAKISLCLNRRTKMLQDHFDEHSSFALRIQWISALACLSFLKIVYARLSLSASNKLAQTSVSDSLRTIEL